MPYIGKSPHFGVRNRFIYTATGDETSKSGADDNGATLTFTDGAYVDVYLNGVLLKPDTDYVTTTANTIGSLSALSTSDILEVIVYDVFSVSDTVSATSGGTFSGAVVAGSTLDMNGTELILDADGDSSITADTDDTINFKAGGSDRLTINSSGDVDIETGDIFFSTAGKGVNLGVTSNTDANTIDDYEEGTYTVTLTCGTSGTATLKSSNNTGQYTKIGRIVHVNCDARIDSVSSPSGSMIFSLPFAASNPPSDEHGGSMGTMITHGTTKQSGQVGNFFPHVDINAASFTLQYENATTRLSVTHDNVGIGANDEFVFSIWYTTPT